ELTPFQDDLEDNAEPWNQRNGKEDVQEAEIISLTKEFVNEIKSLIEEGDDVTEAAMAFIQAAEEANQTAGEVNQVDKGLHLKATEFVKDGKVLLQKAEQVEKDREDAGEAASMWFGQISITKNADFRPELHRIQQAAHTTKLRDNADPSIADHPTLLFPLTLITGSVRQLIEWRKSITSPLAGKPLELRTFQATNEYLDDSLADSFGRSVAVVFAALDKFDHPKSYYGLWLSLNGEVMSNVHWGINLKIAVLVADCPGKDNFINGTLKWRVDNLPDPDAAWLREHGKCSGWTPRTHFLQGIAKDREYGPQFKCSFFNDLSVFLGEDTES
ncbi:hypothetical protein IWQ60_011293, partial [Tieghemiomyces parasiticus]